MHVEYSQPSLLPSIADIDKPCCYMCHDNASLTIRPVVHLPQVGKTIQMHIPLCITFYMPEVFQWHSVTRYCRLGLFTLAATTSADGPAKVVIIFFTDGGAVAVRNIKATCG